MFGKILCMPPVLNIPGFRRCFCRWMCQSFGCTRVLNMPLVLNMTGFWIYQSSEYARVTQGSEYAWIISEYAWICLIIVNVPEYAGKCMNIPKSVWIAFFSPFPTSPFVWQSLSTSTRGYLFERLQETRSYSRKEHETVFLKRQNLIFSIAPESISFVFYFRLNIFTSNI